MSALLSGLGSTSKTLFRAPALAAVRNLSVDRNKMNKTAEKVDSAKKKHTAAICQEAAEQNSRSDSSGKYSWVSPLATVALPATVVGLAIRSSSPSSFNSRPLSPRTLGLLSIW